MKQLLALLLLLVSFNLYATFTVSHHLKVELHPEQGSVYVHDRLGNDLRPNTIYLPRPLNGLKVMIGDKVLAYDIKEDTHHTILSLDPATTTVLKGDIELEYTFKPDPSNDEAMISEKGVYLSPSAYWYPYVETFDERFDLLVGVPGEWMTVTSGELLDRAELGESTYDHWSIAYPSEMIHLIANKFVFNEIEHRGIKIQTYFHPELEAHSETYLQKVANFIDIYMDLFGFYPFSKFAVVSNFFSTGYGMASYTLLDKNIIPYSFIVDASLGHELLHNYWGNSVYVDWEKGNWCEGLTTYQADYLYQQLQSEANAKEYRAGVLRRYQNFVNEDNVFPVRKFRSRFSQASQSIGYGKVMMIFHMMKNRLGEEMFNQVVRKMTEVGMYKFQSWEDWQKLFEEASGEDLSTFFSQWLDRTDLPHLQVKIIDGTLEISQLTKTPYELLVPIEIVTTSQTYVKNFSISEMVTSFSLTLEGEVTTINLDKDFNLMRVLNENENPASLDYFWGQKETQYVSLVEDPALLEIVKGYDQRNQNPSLETQVDFTKSNMLFLTPEDLTDNNVLKLLTFQSRLTLNDGVLSIGEESWDLNEHGAFFSFKREGKITTIIVARDRDLLHTVASKISHYGKYSYGVFNGTGRKLATGIWE